MGLGDAGFPRYGCRSRFPPRCICGCTGERRSRGVDVVGRRPATWPAPARSTTLIALPFIAAKQWHEIDEGKSGPDCEVWCKEVDSDGFMTKLSKKCPAGGNALPAGGQDRALTWMKNSLTRGASPGSDGWVGTWVFPVCRLCPSRVSTRSSRV